MIATRAKGQTNMSRKASLASLLLLGVAVSACSTPRQEGAAVPNRSVYSENQPVVERSDFVLDLPADGDGLSLAERGRLDEWFRSLGAGYGDHVWVDTSGAGEGSRNSVARVAAEYGLLLSDGAPITEGGVQPGTVRVILSRSSASVPNCPNWDRPESGSSMSSNYGCAVNSNWAAMVADPNDLVLGQVGSSSGDAATSSKAIRVYRDTAPTGTKGLQDNSTRRSN